MGMYTGTLYVAYMNALPGKLPWNAMTNRERLGKWSQSQFSSTLIINMAASVGVHLGCTSASLALHKVENQSITISFEIQAL